MSTDVVAERYAGALFELAQEKGQIREVEIELNRMWALMREEPRLTHALYAPDVPTQVKKSIVQSIFAKRLSPLLLNFLYLMVEWHRTEALEEVVTRYHELTRQVEGKVKVEVEVAVPLSAEVQRTVEQRVSALTGKIALLEWRTAPEILGGVILRINDTLIDYSLRTQLNELKERLVRVSA